MRKTILLTALLAASCISAIAQTHYKASLYVGMKGGVELSKMFFNPNVKQKFPMGATAGLTFRYIEEAHFGLQAEVNFAQRGWQYNFEEAPYSYRRTLNYIDIPVLAHIYFGRRGRFFFNAGPQVSFLLSDSYSANFDIYDFRSLPDFPKNDRTNSQFTAVPDHKLDYGICAGLGAEFNVASRHIVSVEARFYYGLGNLYKSEHAVMFRASNQMGIGVTAGYWFRFK